MKTNIIKTLSYLFAIVFLYACKDVVQTDLSNKSLGNVVPADNTVSSSYTQTFRWDAITDATKYQLQIAGPNFSTPIAYFLDTNIVANTFSFTLSPGVYQWRVRAFNNISYSNYITRYIMIDSSLNLNSQLVLLSTPNDNTFSNSLAVNFSWQSIASADNFLFQVLSNNSLIATQSSISTSLTYTFTSEGTYTWKVTAQNTFSTSQPSAVRTIIVDTTEPLVPTPFYPVFDTIHANPIPLKWSISATSNTFDDADYTQLQISTDSTFLNPASIVKDTVMDFTTNPVVYNFYNAVLNQKYYWRVRAYDKAGNYGAYFTPRRIKRN